MHRTNPFGRRVAPRLTILEDRTTPAPFAPGSIQGQDGWSGGSVAVNAAVSQGVDQSGTLGHLGGGALVVSNSTANGNFNGGFAGWPFGPALSVVAGQPSSGAPADMFSATVWFRTVNSVADGSNVEINLGTADGTDRNTIIGIVNDTDAFGGLQFYITEPDGSTGNLFEYQYTPNNLARGVWHRLDIVATFRDGSANDTVVLSLNGTPIVNTATNATTFGTLEGYFAGQPTPSYPQTNRLMFRSGFSPNQYSSDFTDTGAGGFAFDDISYFSANSANPNVPLASYYAGFETRPSLVYTNPAWTPLANGTLIPDANPNLSGDQPATVGVDAFGTLGAGSAAVAIGGQVFAFPTATTGSAVIPNGVTLAPGGSNGASAVSNVGNVGLSIGSIFAVELLGPAAGTQYDQLIVDGAADIGGATLDVKALYTPAPTDSFTILQATSLVGQFAGLPEGALVTAGSVDYRIRYTPTSVVLELDRADLSVTITDNQPSVTAGQQVSYTVVVRNDGPRAVNGAVFALTPPAGLLNSTFGSVAAGGATGNTGGAGPISNSLFLPVGATVTYTITGTVSLTATGSLAVTATVTPPANAVVDPNPANNTATDTDTITPPPPVIPPDTTRPTAQISAPGPLVVGTPVTLAINFSEVVSGFVSGDVQLTNATLTSFSGSGANYSVTITPTGSSVQVALLDGAAADAANNASVAVSATFPAIVPDTTRPTVQIVPAASLVVGTPVTLTISFSEPVIGFGSSQLGLVNATLSGFSGSGATYTAVIVPTAPSVQVGLADGVGRDAAGNPSVAAISTFTAALPATPTPTPTVQLRYATAMGGTVKVYDPATGFTRVYTPFPGFNGNVTVATGDLNGDGIPETVVGAGAGGTPQVKVYDGATGQDVLNFLAYDASFSGGVFVAVGGGKIVTGAGAGGGPHVKVFDTFARVTSQFFAYDTGFTGGVTVATGDVNGDGVADIVTGAGAGGTSHVRVFDGSSGQNTLNFLAYDVGFTGGVFVAVGGGRIFTGAGAGGSPHVRAFDGITGQNTLNFLAFDSGFTGGVRVAVNDVNNDGVPDLFTAAGPGGGPHVKAFALPNIALTASFFVTPLDNSTPVMRFGSDTAPGSGSPGVFVG